MCGKSSAHFSDGQQWLPDHPWLNLTTPALPFEGHRPAHPPTPTLPVQRVAARPRSPGAGELAGSA